MTTEQEAELSSAEHQMDAENHRARIGAPRRCRLRRSVRESLLLDAALQQFIERGFAASRMEDVAVRAGVAKGTPYLYFSSKEALLLQVIAKFLCSEIEALEQVIASRLPQASAVDLISNDIAGWWSRLVDSPAAAVFKLLVSDAPTLPEVASFCSDHVVGRFERLMGNVIQTGINHKQLACLDVTAAVRALNLPLVMLCVHRHSIELMMAPDRHINAREFIASHMRRIVSELRSDDKQGEPRRTVPEA